MPIPEGQPLQILKALEGRRADVAEFNSDIPESRELRRWFDSQWEQLEAEEILGGPVELGAEWNTRVNAERNWINQDTTGKRRELAKRTANAYREIVQIEEQIRRNPSEARGIRQRNIEIITQAQKLIEKVSSAEGRGENFPQFVQLGFEYLIDDEVDQSRIDAYFRGDFEQLLNGENIGSGEGQQKRVDDVASWKELGWKEDWGDVPKFEEEQLQGELRVALDIARLQEIRGGDNYAEILRLLDRLVKKVWTNKQYTRTDKELFNEAINHLRQKYSEMEKKDAFSLDSITEDMYNEAIHGLLPEELVPEMQPLYKKILVLRGSKEWKEVLEKKDVVGIRKMARRLGLFFDELLGYQKHIGQRSEIVVGEETRWVEALEGKKLGFQVQIDQLSRELEGEQDQDVIQEKTSRIVALARQRDDVQNNWDQSRAAFDRLWVSSWDELYDEHLFGPIPEGLLDEMKPLYQQLRMIHEAPPELITQRDVRDLAEAQSRLRKFDRVRQFALAKWNQLEGRERLAVLEQAEEVAASRGEVLTDKQREAVQRPIIDRWSTGQAVFESFWKNCWNEVYRENEFQRRDTLDAFIQFAKRKNCFGDFEQMDGYQKDRLDQLIVRMLESDDPLHDTDLEVRKLFLDFKSWFRGWMIGEMSDVMDVNQNSFISGMSQITARLNVSGLWSDVPIITIIGTMDTSKASWREFVGESIGQLQAMSAIHNRERLYARVKNIHPSEIVKAMVGIAEQSAGRSESLGMTAESWTALFGMDVVSNKEHAEPFGETVRKAMAIFLKQDRTRNGGDLTVGDLLSVGITREAIQLLNDRVFVDSAKIDVNDEKAVVIKNVFPLESKGNDFVQQQKANMAFLLAPNAVVASLEQKAAKLAVGLAFKSMEAGFVGADLDAEATGKEVVYRLLHSRIYRTKYCFQSKEAGNPLTVDAVDRCLLPYFDMIFLPVNGSDGSVQMRSLRDWILGRKPKLNVQGRYELGAPDQKTKRSSIIYEEDRVPASEIPFMQMSQTPDYVYYDSALKWGNDLWDYLIKGSGVKWTSVIVKLTDEGIDVNPEYVAAIQEYYKKLGYWVGGFDPYQLQAIVFPGDGVHEESFMNQAFSSWYYKKLRQNGKVYDDGAFKADVQKAMLRRIAVIYELMQYGVEYNPALKSMFTFRDEVETWLNQRDRKYIRTLLVDGVSHDRLMKNLERESDAWEGGFEFHGLFNDAVVSAIFDIAGVVEGSARKKDFMRILQQIAERAALLRAGRR